LRHRLRGLLDLRRGHQLIESLGRLGLGRRARALDVFLSAGAVGCRAARARARPAAAGAAAARAALAGTAAAHRAEALAILLAAATRLARRAEALGDAAAP